ncbi:MAG: protein-L-isoaspartate O-methyltransferase [Deltaproteobacteria bacterium]|nr:MAG: protein-L-isoaspartate O-methyltransferase [Deltaproteobacteria bacterium]
MVKVIMLLSAALLIISHCRAAEKGEEVFREERERMVKEQIKARGIDDPRLLSAMGKVPRHLFVPPEYRDSAYEDRPLPIGYGQTISQPYIVALMTYHLQLKPTDRVLEIGTGSGYQAAVLAELVKEVYTIEIIPELAKEASERLKELGYENVHVKCGDGFFGWPEHAPFDAIIITCAAPEVPPRLVDQLREGGRMILPLGADPFYQTLTLIIKRDGKLEKRRITGVVFVPMTGEIEKRRR